MGCYHEEPAVFFGDRAMNRPLLRYFSLLTAVLLLSGCSASVPIQKSSVSSTLPPAKAVFQAPGGDEYRSYAETVLLYLPSASDGRITAEPFMLSFPFNQHPAETTIRKLLSFAGNDQSLALSEHLELRAGSSLEISGKTATVDLNAAALELDRQQLADVCRAITNTLCQWQDIRFVNILINGKQQGIDIAATLPMGSLQLTENERPLWESIAADERFVRTATLYFPAHLGKGVLAEARTITFHSNSLSDMVDGLLIALSSGATTLPNTPKLPELINLLADSPELVIAGNGERYLKLHFLQKANEAFITAGVPRSVMVASLAMTTTTFLPGIDGIMIQLGDELVQSITPNSIYTNPGQAVQFENGIIRRRFFDSFLLDLCPLYFSSRERLVRVLRPIPYEYTQNVRYLLEQLLSGPNPADSVNAPEGVLPASVKSADLIGFMRENDTVLLNFSPAFASDASSLNKTQEQIAIYSIVNTLCELRGIKRLRFFIAGAQPETLSGAIYLPGEFLYNSEIME